MVNCCQLDLDMSLVKIMIKVYVQKKKTCIIVFKSMVAIAFQNVFHLELEMH